MNAQREYYLNRAEEARLLAADSRLDRVRVIHAAIARNYEKLAQELTQEATGRIVGDPMCGPISRQSSDNDGDRSIF